MTIKTTLTIAAVIASLCAAMSVLFPASSLVSVSGWCVAAFVLVAGYRSMSNGAVHRADPDADEVQSSPILPWDYAKQAISVELHRARRRAEPITLLKLHAPVESKPSAPEKMARKVQDCVRITDIVSFEGQTCYCLLAGSKKEIESAKTRVFQTVDVSGRGIETTVVSFPDDELTFCGMLGEDQLAHA